MSSTPVFDNDGGGSASAAAAPNAPGHDEWLIDESLAETFPASDPPSSVRPGSTVATHYAARWRPWRLPAPVQALGSSRSFWMIVAGSIAATAWLARRRR